MLVLKSQAAETAQGGEKRQKGEPQDRRMIPLDRLEQMDAKPFELVNADAFEHIGAREVEIEVDRLVGQGPQGEIGSLREALHGLSTDGKGSGGMKGVPPSGKTLELKAGCLPIRRLVKHLPVALQDLIG